MRKGSLAAGAAVAAVAVFTVVPATAAVPGQEASSTPMCATSQLTGSLGAGDAGAGNLYRYLVLTNRSSTTCHLTGFPGVSLLDASGRQIGPAATREHTSYAPVTLKPGGSASDTVHTVNHQGTCLPTSTRVRVYPPGNTASLVLVGAITNCHSVLSITPLAAGTGGNPAGSSPSSGATAGSGSGGQVTAVPSGAPDTGTAAISTGGARPGRALGAAAGGVLALGGAGFAVALRRRAWGRG
ncbi:DUF4232 domain-containing protein [Streptomyces sp. NBC_01230]|uniref:DUF4232 domain-containing protein n=1 Tax=unclassified Streptomyces TaxID=2593676 RepID=UPI002E12E9B8|nr:DUF4232 domain-containing protein [Streptomyces sp. NBC_01230]